MGAISIIGYLHVGRKLREWMPIFLYALPVTAVSAVVATLAAMLLEGAALVQMGSTGVFGYFDRQHFGWILYLACGPGIVGHTGFNTLLRFFPPLVISMAFPLEPIVGSMIGAAAGISNLPGPLTWVGGGIMVRLACHAWPSETTSASILPARTVPCINATLPAKRLFLCAGVSTSSVHVAAGQAGCTGREEESRHARHAASTGR